MSVENGSRGLSNLACYTCKRRKTKCSRTLPQCSLCVRIGEGCDYPTSAEKPGPKLGTVQRNRRRRSGLQARQSPSLTSRDAPISPVESLSPVSPRRTRQSQRQDVLSQHSTASPAYITAERRGTRQELGIPEEETGPATSEAPIFSQIMYPSHEAQTRPQSPAPSGYPVTSSSTTPTITVETVCVGLGITIDTYTCLMDLFFEYMTAFSLFRPHRIQEKFQKMASIVEAQALIASMFAFSARFAPSGDFNDYPTPAYFSDMTTKLLERAIVDSGDNSPPLWILQASVLDTFYHLTRSVRSRSWRLLGNCIRLAYDRKMHLLDLNSPARAEAHQSEHDHVADWPMLEEQRRCWWAIWEMDVFASTIRRLPTAIDEKQNFTLLPMPDECWFTGVNQPSCFLAEDINERWKGLPRVSNTSPKAWFIVINSLMHDAQRLVYNPGTSKSGLTNSQRDDLTIISNSLYCATASLPAELKYSGEMLDFRTKRSAADANFRQYHSDIYAIHNMTQLTQFMVFHNKLCSQAPWSITPQDAGENSTSRPFDHASWSNYMKSAEAIVSIVRNSDHSHFKSVNPFLNNTLWFAAAAQIACVVFGPSSYGRALLRSNYELLALTIDQFIEFWASIDILRPRLQKIESALRNLSQRGAAQQGGEEQYQSRPREIQNRRETMAQSRMTDNHSAVSEGVDSNRNMPAGDTDILAFMPLFQDFDDMALLAQQTGVDDFNLELPFGMDDF